MKCEKDVTRANVNEKSYYECVPIIATLAGTASNKWKGGK
jgi:hypothetical protein